MEISSKKEVSTKSTNVNKNYARPSTSRQNYWQYFGFPADKLGTIINRQNIICTLCNKIMVYNQNANNYVLNDKFLKDHLAAVHPEIDEKIKISNQLGGALMITAPHQKQEPVITVNSQPPQPPPQHSFSKNVVTQYKIKQKTFQQSVVDEDESIQYLIPEDEASLIQNDHEHEQDIDSMAIDGEEYDHPEKLSINIDNGGDNISKTVKYHHKTKTEIVEYGEDMQQIDYKRNDELRATSKHDNEANLILEMFVRDLSPLTLIDGEGFRYFCQQQSNVQFSAQNSEQLEMEIKKLFKKTQLHEIKSNEINMKYFSIGCDRWRNYQDKYFLSFTINYECLSSIGEYCKLKTLPLFTIQSESLVSGSPVTLENLFQNLNMTFCMGVVRNFSLDLEKPLQEFLDKQNIRSIECFASIINQIGAKIVNEIVKPYFLNINKYLKLNEQKIKELNQILTSIPTKIHSHFWITVYDYLNYFKDVYQIISIKTKNHNDEQLFNEINQIITLLAPIHMALTTMPEQKPLASVILPLVQQLIQHQFNSHDDDDDDDGENTILAKQIKDLVKNIFNKSLFNNEFLMLASFLDPRFHHLTEKKNLKKLKIDLQELAPSDSTKLPQTPAQSTQYSGTSSESQIKSEPKKSTNSGLSYFFAKQSDGRSSLTKKIQSKFDIELNSYITNAMADIEQCPLQWWSDHKNIYSNLQLIAQRFNCLPAFITPNLHQPIKQQILLFNNRFMMNEHQPINEMLWLHGFKYGDSSNRNISLDNS